MRASLTGKTRLELHLHVTGKGRRMRAVRPDGTVLAVGRDFGNLREKVRRAVSELYGPEVEVALLVGAPRPPRLDVSNPPTQSLAPRG